MADTLTDWIGALRQALRPELRPDPDDTRWGNAAFKAYKNGWTPGQLAAAVNAHNYTGANRPTSVALTVLEQICGDPPRSTAGGLKKHTAGMCPCGTPGCAAGHDRAENPEEWVARIRAQVRRAAWTAQPPDDGDE